MSCGARLREPDVHHIVQEPDNVRCDFNFPASTTSVQVGRSTGDTVGTRAPKRREATTMLMPTVFARTRIACRRPALCVARAAETAALTRNSVELEDLVDIIKAVDTSDLVEMELTGKKFSMTVKKHEALKAAEPVYIQAGPAPSAPSTTL
jgi:hypothetical protein